MSGVDLRPLARRDLAEIWSYTERNWGAAQADSYIREIRDRMEAAASNPHSGADCSELYPELRRTRSRSHIIYYLADEERIDVVRILHERRNAGALI